MQKLLSKIDNLQSTILQLDVQDSNFLPRKDDARTNIQDIFNSIKNKFNMLCYCVGYSIEAEQKLKVIQLKYSQHQGDCISFPVGYFNRYAIYCNVFTLISLTTSIIDNIKDLLWEIYFNELNTIYKKLTSSEKSLEKKQFKTSLFFKILDETIIGIILNKYLINNRDFKRIISLRDQFNHSNFDKILTSDEDFHTFFIREDYAPIGKAMPLSGYSQFVYYSISTMLSEVFGCISEHPKDCIKA